MSDAEERDESGTPEPSWRTLPQELEGSLALGFLAMLPLILVYEVAVAREFHGPRSTAELTLFRLLEVFGSHADQVRWLLLTVAGAVAFGYCLKRHLGLGPPLLRVAVEGALGALAIGPVLIGLVLLLGDWVPPPDLGVDPSRAPQAVRAAFVIGAGAYEELLFRVGAYSLLYMAGGAVLKFLGLQGPVARWGAEVTGLLGSSLLFAASHLAAFTAWLGPGGEAFDLSVFTWRLLAGILLGLLFRWRGVGVAAWTHGLFNLALLLGAGPDVFL